MTMETREVSLAQYLPGFMREFQELVAALEAQDPEFALAWEAVGRVLRNRFISTADAYGIARFERMLGIYPASDDPLDYRRERVLQKFGSLPPYTVRFLREKLSGLYGDGYGLDVDHLACAVTVKVTSDRYGAMGLLWDLLRDVLPAHLRVFASQEVTGVSSGQAHVGGLVSGTQVQTVPPETAYGIPGDLPVAGIMARTAIQSIGG